MVNHFEDVFNNDAKFAINSFIGCLKPKLREKYKLRGLTQCQDEAFGFHLQFDGSKVHSIRTNGQIYYELFEKQHEFINETELEIYNHILEEAIIYLHQLSKIVEENGGCVLDLSTDSVSCVFRGEFPFKTKEINNKPNGRRYAF